MARKMINGGVDAFAASNMQLGGLAELLQEQEEPEEEEAEQANAADGKQDKAGAAGGDEGPVGVGGGDAVSGADGSSAAGSAVTPQKRKFFDRDAKAPECREKCAKLINPVKDNLVQEQREISLLLQHQEINGPLVKGYAAKARCVDETLSAVLDRSEDAEQKLEAAIRFKTSK